MNDDVRNIHANRAPINCAPGAHPLGTGFGAVVGGTAAGAYTAASAYPIGTLVGAVPGDFVGGLAFSIAAPMPAPTRTPPLPPEIPLPPLEIPPQREPEVREPDLPGELIPIRDGPSPADEATSAVFSD